MNRPALGVAAIVLVALWSGIGRGEAVTRGDGPCVATTGPNLLRNPSFEEGSGLAKEWTNESKTAGKPIFTVSDTHGVVTGGHAQRMVYEGTEDDDNSKVQFFQAPVEGVEPGSTVQFTLCVAADGSEGMSKSYAIIGIESFRTDATYISDVSTNIIGVDSTPTQYTSEYEVPPDAAYLAVFVQAPEFASVSKIDIYFDEAALRIVAPPAHITPAGVLDPRHR